ncbi:MAG: adenylate/guanylate cyclase domain-containing protein [Candidatus Ozemobacteraceae bacterium]
MNEGTKPNGKAGEEEVFRFPGIGIAAIWILIALLPALGASFLTRTFVESREERDHQEQRRSLTAEMRQFHRELSMQKMLTNLLGDMDKKLGLTNAAAPEFLRRLQDQRRTVFVRIERAIKRAVGIEPAFLLLVTRSPGRVLWKFDTSIVAPEEGNRIASWVPHFGNLYCRSPRLYDSGYAGLPTRDTLDEASELVLGKNFSIGSPNHAVMPFITAFGETGTGWWRAGWARSKEVVSSGKIDSENDFHDCGILYIAVFHGKNLPMEPMIRHTLRRNSEELSGTKRLLVAVPRSLSLPRFVKTPAGNIQFLHASPTGIAPEILQKIYGRPIPRGFRVIPAVQSVRSAAESRRPLLRTTDSARTISITSATGAVKIASSTNATIDISSTNACTSASSDSSVPRSSRDEEALLDILLLIFCGISALIAFRFHLRGFPAGVGLPIKVALGFSLGALMPVIGLGALTFSWVHSQEQIRETALFAHLNRQLQRLEGGATGTLHQSSRRLLAWEKHLEKKISRPMSELERELLEMLSRSLCRTIFFFRNDTTEWFNTNYGDKSTHQSFVPIFRGYFQDLMIKMGTFFPADGTDPHAIKYQTLITLARSLIGQFADEQLFFRMLANPRRLFPSPLGNLHQWFSVVNIPPGKPREKSRGMMLIIGSGQDNIEGYLTKVSRATRVQPERFGEFDIRYYFYEILSFNPPEITKNTFGGRDRDWQRFHSSAIQCMIAQMPLQGRETTKENPYHSAARRLGTQGYIGVVVATPSDRSTAASAHRSFVVALFTALLGLWCGATGFAALLLTLPLPPFMRAVRATAAGRFQWRIELEQPDEFGELGKVFNEMARGLREREGMARFVSDDVLQAVGSDDDAGMSLGGQRIEGAILFSDIRGFTTLSETHAPEEVVTMLNAYFTSMEQCIRSEGGVIDSFIGDAILAVFPAGKGTTGAAARACRAAGEMRQALSAFNKERATTEAFTIQTGIGIASGIYLSGRVGSETGRLAQVVMGEPVERATALESLSKHTHGSGIILDAETRRLASVQTKPLKKECPRESFMGEAFELIL